jgi:hypothetical protein
MTLTGITPEEVYQEAKDGEFHAWRYEDKESRQSISYKYRGEDKSPAHIGHLKRY